MSDYISKKRWSALHWNTPGLYGERMFHRLAAAIERDKKEAEEKRKRQLTIATLQGLH